MKAYMTDNGEIIIVEEGQTLEATLNSPDYNEGCEVRLNGDIAEYYIAGQYVSSTLLTQLEGHRKVSAALEGWIIEDGDQLAVAVCRDGRDVIIGHDSMESALKHLYGL